MIGEPGPVIRRRTFSRQYNTSDEVVNQHARSLCIVRKMYMYCTIQYIRGPLSPLLLPPTVSRDSGRLTHPKLISTFGRQGRILHTLFGCHKFIHTTTQPHTSTDRLCPIKTSMNYYYESGAAFAWYV